MKKSLVKLEKQTNVDISVPEMTEKVLAEISPLFPDLTTGNNRYFFTGEKKHSVTQAHAGILLHELGYTEISANVQKNVLIQLHFHRAEPPSEHRAIMHAGTELQPLKAEYWGQNFKDDHGYKIPWAAFSLLKEIDPSARDKSVRNLALLFSTIR